MSDDAKKKFREAACDAWIELRYQGVDGPSVDVSPYVDTIFNKIVEAHDAIWPDLKHISPEDAKFLREVNASKTPHAPGKE